MQNIGIGRNSKCLVSVGSSITKKEEKLCTYLIMSQLMVELTSVLTAKAFILPKLTYVSTTRSFEITAYNMVETQKSRPTFSWVASFIRYNHHIV